MQGKINALPVPCLYRILPGSFHQYLGSSSIHANDKQNAQENSRMVLPFRMANTLANEVTLVATDYQSFERSGNSLFQRLSKRFIARRL